MHHACWDAKNRCCLPEELPLDWESIAYVIPDNFSQQSTAQQMILQAQLQEIDVQKKEKQTYQPSAVQNNGVLGWDNEIQQENNFTLLPVITGLKF